MFNNIFQQQMPANNSFGMGGYFPQNNGLSFNNVAPAKTSSSTPEEMAIIKSQKKNNFTVSPEELAQYGWDLRDGQTLAIEIVDPSTERVRIKYTNEEFNIVMQPKEVLDELLSILKNFGYTTALMNTTDSPDVLKELLTAIGVVCKLLPIAYMDGQKNYNNICNQMQNMINTNGYQGSWGGQQVFNGSIGAVPNYIINDGNNMMMQNMNVMNPQQQMLQAAAQMGAQQMQQQMLNGMMGSMGMGAPTVPNGGTMMGNPFVQNGAPQVTPTVTPAPAVPAMTPTPTPGVPALNSIPAPGTPVNPPMGTTSNTVKI